MVNFDCWTTFTNKEFDNIIGEVITLNPSIDIDQETDNGITSGKFVTLKWTSDNDVKSITLNFDYGSQYINIYGEYNIYEDDIWTKDNVDYILLTFFDFQSAWNWFNDTDYSIDAVDQLAKIFWNVDGGVQYPIPEDILEDLNGKKTISIYD